MNNRNQTIAWARALRIQLIGGHNSQLRVGLALQILIRNSRMVKRD